MVSNHERTQAVKATKLCIRNETKAKQESQKLNPNPVVPK